MKLQLLLAIVCGIVWVVGATEPSASSTTSSSGSQSSTANAALPAQSRSDQALKSAINQVLGSAVAAASNLPSSSASTYYTNDLSQFIAAGNGEGQQKLESRQQLTPGSQAAAVSGAGSSSSPSAASSSSSLGIPYQALLQALANSQSAFGSGSSSGNQAQLFSAASSLNPSVVLPPSTGSGSTGGNWASPSSWSSSPSSSGSNSGSSSGGFLQMLRPSQIGGRRSSLTSRLKNFMNSLFYRSESSQPYASASTNSYAYRPAPFGFNAMPSSFGGFSSLYGSGSGSSSLNGGPFASLFGSSSQSSPSYSFPSAGSLYGASSNYRPSFVAMPNLFGAGGESASWSSPGSSSFAGLGPYSDTRGKNYAGSVSNNYGGNSGNQGADSNYGSSYGQDSSYNSAGSGRWANSGSSVNSGPSPSATNPGAIWSSQYQSQGYGANSLTGVAGGSNNEGRGLGGQSIAANYQDASAVASSSYYPSYQQRISSLTSSASSGATGTPMAASYGQQQTPGISDRISAAYSGAGAQPASKSGY